MRLDSGFVGKILIADPLGSSTGGIGTSTPSSVETAISNLSGRVHVRNIALQPGGSMIFASLPESDKKPLKQLPSSFSGSATSSPYPWSPTKGPGPEPPIQPVIFALRGSPIVSACCFRFLVSPYIRTLIGMEPEQPIMARVTLGPPPAAYRLDHAPPAGHGKVVDGSPDYDQFRHAVLQSQNDGVFVEIARERSVAKASPFASSNCWLHVPRGHAGIANGDAAYIWPFCSPKS